MKHIGNLKYAKGSRHKKKRIGRGQGSGYGGTSTKGHKGQQSRAGYSRNFAFEGGQMPLQRRLPKRGFTSINKKDYNLINLRDLDCFDADSTVTLELYGKAGLVKKMKDGIKILADGELSKSLTVQAHKFSSAAIEKIEAAGGKAEVI